MGIKDIFEFQGVKSTMGSRVIPSYIDLIRRARISSRNSLALWLLLLERRKLPLLHRRKIPPTNTLISTVQSIPVATATKARLVAHPVQLLVLQAVQGLITPWLAILCSLTDQSRKLRVAFESLPPAMGRSLYDRLLIQHR